MRKKEDSLYANFFFVLCMGCMDEIGWRSYLLT